jgi:hypothetical protein
LPTKAPASDVPVTYITLYPDVSGGDRVGALSRIDGALTPIIAGNIEYLYRAISPWIIQKLKDDVADLLRRVAALELVSPSPDQKAALAGYPEDSPPELSNKYLTEAFIPLISSSWTIPTPLLVSPQGTDPAQGGEVGVRELAAHGTNYTSFLAPDSLVDDLRYVLPSFPPTTGQVLGYDPSISGYPGLYPLKWVTAAAGPGGDGLTYPLVILPSGTGSGQAGEVQFRELAANGVSYISLLAPDALSTTRRYVLPGAIPAAGQVLTFDNQNTDYPPGYYPLKWARDNWKWVKATESANGTRKTFSVPDLFVTGTLVVIADGQILVDSSFSPVEGVDYSVSGQVVTIASGRAAPLSYVAFLYQVDYAA